MKPTLKGEIPIGDEQELEEETETVYHFIMTTSGINKQQAIDRLEDDIRQIVKRDENIADYGILEPSE